MKVLSLFGTRPEAIKMAPVVRALTADANFEAKVCVTAQHRQMLDQVLDLFEITTDYDLDIMRADQDLYDVTSRVLLGVRDVLQKEKPDIILVHGDTTTCFAGTLAGFYAQIPVAHVEAGLRTGNLAAPFPEEANRVLTGKLASLHFAPTEKAKENLVVDGVNQKNVIVTGNTVIDALLWVRKKMVTERVVPQVFGSAQAVFDEEKPFVLITGHRRENFGKGFLNICEAISVLSSRYPDIHFVYPVHLNPNVQEPVQSILGSKENVHLIPPLDYAPFVFAMDRCLFILTDSGGVQEEAPSLNKRVLVMRETTERPEAVNAGVVVLVGTNVEKIISEAERLLGETVGGKSKDRLANPYGDGRAAERIRDFLLGYQKEG